MTTAVRVTSGALAVGLCGLAMWLTDVKPRFEDRLQKPIVSQGHTGRVAHNRIFAARVDRVDVATGVVPSSSGSRTGPAVDRSTGVFVVVQLSVRSEREPLRLGHARLITRDGLSYQTADRAPVANGLEFPAMLWKRTWFLFELPKDRLAGVRFAVGQGNLLDNLSAEVDVDLGIDRREAARMLANAPGDYRLPRGTS